MRNLPKCLLVILGLVLPMMSFSQEVSNLTNVTANGGVSVDEDGNLLVAHFGPLPPNPSVGKNIYKITPDGVVSLFVDNQLNVGSGNAIDEAGFLYQSNFATGAIYKIAPNGMIVDANYANVAGPVGIAAADNTLYVCSCNENAVKQISDDGTISNFATGSFFTCANGITMDNLGNLYTTNFGDGRITKISPDGTAQTLGNTTAGNGHIAYRSGEDMLYIASYSGHQIFKMDLTGNVSVFAGTGAAATVNALDPLQAAFNKPNGIAISKDNCSLYVTQDDGVIRNIDLSDAFCITDVEEIEQQPDLNMYPNPARTQLYFENNSELIFKQATILNSQGQVLKQLALSADELLTFDVSAFSDGVYAVLLTASSGQLFSYRFVKVD